MQIKPTHFNNAFVFILFDLSITDTGNAVGYPNQLQNNERPRPHQ